MKSLKSLLLVLAVFGLGHSARAITYPAYFFIERTGPTSPTGLAWTDTANVGIHVDSTRVAHIADSCRHCPGGGSVFSVGVTLPSSVFAATGSPVTTSGTIAATLNSQTANTFFAAPNGSSGVPSFRAFLPGDISFLTDSMSAQRAYTLARVHDTMVVERHFDTTSTRSIVHDTSAVLQGIMLGYYNNSTTYANARIHDSLGALTPARIGAEPAITAGTTAQYWRGDKSWQTLPTSMAPSGTASGDLSGTYPGPTVAKVNGVTVQATGASAPWPVTSGIPGVLFKTSLGPIQLTNGASVQFVKGDGTLDGSVYLTGSGTSGKLSKWMSTYGLTDASGAEINATFGSQTANTFYAAPNGSAGNPSFRAMVAADVPTLNQSTTGSAAKWTTARTLSYTGDATGSMSVDGSANASAALTLASTITAGGPTGGAATVPVITYDAKGRLTAVSTATITPASIGAQTALSGGSPNSLTRWATSTTLGNSDLVENSTYFALTKAISSSNYINANSAVIGQWTGGSGYAMFINSSLYGQNDAYAIFQGTTGETWVNAKSGHAVNITNANGTSILRVSAGGVRLSGADTVDASLVIQGTGTPLSVPNGDISTGGIYRSGVYAPTSNFSLASATSNVVYVNTVGLTMTIPSSGVTPGTVFHLCFPNTTIISFSGLTLYYNGSTSSSGSSWNGNSEYILTCASATAWYIK